MIFRHVISVRSKAEVAEQTWELACSVTKQAAGSNFMSHAHRLWACSARKLAIISTMLNIVATVSITIRNW